MIGLPLKTYLINVLWRSTSKKLLIRATTQAQAIAKAAKLKECVDAMAFECLEERDDDRTLGI